MSLLLARRGSQARRRAPIGTVAFPDTVPALAVTVPTPVTDAVTRALPPVLGLVASTPAPTALGSGAVTFTGSNGAAWPSPWVTSVGGAGALVDIQSNRGRMVTGNAQWISARAFHGSNSYTDVEVVAKLAVPNPIISQFCAVAVRGDSWVVGQGDFPVNGYLVQCRPGMSQVVLVDSVGGVAGTSTVARTFTAGVDVWVRVQAVGSVIRAKVWDVGSSEPVSGGPSNDGWIVNVTDTTAPVASGKWGLSTASDAANQACFWDDVTFTDLGAGGGGGSSTVTPASVARIVVTPAVSAAPSGTAFPAAAVVAASVPSVTTSRSGMAAPAAAVVAAVMPAVNAVGSGGATATPASVAVRASVPAPMTGADYLSFAGVPDNAPPPAPWVVPASVAGESVSVQLEQLRFTSGPAGSGARAVMSGQFTGLTDFDRVAVLTPQYVSQFNNFCLRMDTFQATNNYPANGYGVSIRVTSGLEKVVLAKVTNGSWIQQAAGNFTYTANTSVKVWTRITGGATTVIKVWVWQVGNPAPADTDPPTATWTDTSSPHLSGLWGFGSSGFGASEVAYLDDIELAAPVPGGGGAGGGAPPPSESGAVAWTPSTVEWDTDTVEWI